MGGTLHTKNRYEAQGYYRTLKIGDLLGGNYVEIDKDGILSFNGTAKISDDSEQADSFVNLAVSKNFSMGVFGDATGVNITDSNLTAAQLYPELKAAGTALTAGNVAYGLRNRFLINKAQTNNVSLYATQGQLRVKADLAAGVHSGLFGYLEQSGTVTLSSSGAFNSACNLSIETDASLTLDAGVNLEGLTITSNINTGGTLNGNINGIHLRAEASKQPWTIGVLIENSTTGIKMTGTVITKGLDIQLYSGAASASGLIMGGGTTANPITTATADAKFIEFRCQTTASSGDNRLMYLRYDIAGTTGGECIRAFTKGSAALGTARGVHFSLDMAAAGSISGLGAGVDAQIMLAASTTYSTGTWAVVNAEVYTGASTVISATAFSFFRAVNSGSAQSTVDDNAFLFELAGFTSGAAKLWYDNQGAAPANIEEWVKVKTPSGTRWLALYNAVV